VTGAFRINGTPYGDIEILMPAPIPEPLSLLLLGMGITAFGIIRKRESLNQI